MHRKSITIAFALTLILGAVAAQAQECPHSKEPAGCAGENPAVGKDKCIWSWEGVNWTLLEKDGTLVAQAVVPGCGKRSMAIRTSIAAKVPECKKNTCGCGSCPFGAEGVTFTVKNEAKALFVTATGPADKLAAYKAATEKKIAAARSGEGCGCGAEKKAEFKPEGEKAGGCGCGK
ncbi:MAG: hypothetical protein ABIK09_15470 [Pseudomonadota bacterium]